MPLVIGCDLSGPANTADTALACFEGDVTRLHHVESVQGIDDAGILERAARAGEDGLVVGLDAPLCYNPGGGLRAADRALMERLSSSGLKAGVMAPTMTRMVYLTLRGVSLARALQLQQPDARVVEVHPGAALLLRDAPATSVAEVKRDPKARSALKRWLRQRGLHGLPRGAATDHMVMAWGAAMAAWLWSMGQPAWVWTAQAPLQPYDFAC